MRPASLRLKGWAGALLFRTGLYRLWLRGRAVVVVFHRVDDRLKGNPIGCTVDEFREYCDFFARYFRVLPLAELLGRMRRGEEVGGCLAITFDDGYRDNYTVAARELKERGLPACFFIATELIGSRTQPPWDREWGARATWMSWDEVRALHAEGFEIGAHTMNHADLGRTSGAEAVREIRGSRERLERELGAGVTLFSYPYGGAARMTEENREIVRAAGFECCLSGYGGMVAPGDDPLRLRRHAASPWHVSAAHFGFELLLRPPAIP